MHQAKHRQQKAKDRNRSNQRPQPPRRVSKNKRSREVDEQRRHLHDDQTRGVRIQRERARRRDRQPGIIWRAQREQLHQTEDDHPQNWPLQAIEAEAGRPQNQRIQRPETDDTGGAQRKRRQRPVVNRSIGQRREHNPNAKHQDDQATGDRMPALRGARYGFFSAVR